jgi:putative protein-disulfide isomerase
MIKAFEAFASKRQIIYFADPMCSWCWGFSPVIEKIVARYGGGLPIRLVMGGLRAGNTKPMDQGMKEDIRGHWQHVSEQTGQEFDYSFFERDGFVYDTGPACRAVVAVRQISPGRELVFLKTLHEAFYKRGIDLTKGSELLRVAIEFGLDERVFSQYFSEEDCSRELVGDFNLVLNNGIRAFPALLGGTEVDGFMSITHGYRKYEELEPSLARLLSANILPKGLMPGLSTNYCSIDDQ